MMTPARPLSLMCLIAVMLFTPVHAFSQVRLTGNEFSMRAPVYARNGMVATSHPLASQIGLEVLKDGGNAIDAAIAANAALGLMEPTGCGIGGDLFALVWVAREGKLYGLNASGRAPQSVDRAKLVQEGLEEIPMTGALSVTVPGAVDGWFMLLDRFGSKPIAELLGPAIEYAREGFPLTPEIGMLMNRSLQRYAGAGLPNIEKTYQVNGNWPDAGEVYKNPMLAKVYRLLAERGRDAFYAGRVAEAIVEVVQSNGGYLTEADLANHKGNWVEPVSTDYRGYELWEIPPNGQGIAALQILNILETFDFSDVRFGSKTHIHRFAEAKKLAYEDRAKYYADPDFENVPIARLISKAYARERAKLIDPQRARMYEAGEMPDQGDTIYLTTADKAGNMVSLIQSNYGGMGSGMVPKGMGFMLQNRGAAFSLDADHKNRLEPGKRPFHTIIPAFVTREGKPFLSFGVMGGSMQPQGHAQIMMNIVDFGMDPQEAGDAPRIRHEDSSTPEGKPAKGTGTLGLEDGFDPVVKRDLYFMRHKISYELFYGGYQGIMWNEEGGYYIGATESRFDGQAVGY